MFEKVIQFFQTRRVTAQVQPNIEVDYNPWSSDEIKLHLKGQWESLLKELNDSPELIKERKWSDTYYDGKRRESMTLEIDGVIIHLQGPYYEDLSYVRPVKPEQKTETERGNDILDQLITTSTMIWGLTHCSERKYEAFIEFIKATRSSREATH